MLSLKTYIPPVGNTQISDGSVDQQQVDDKDLSVHSKDTNETTEKASKSVKEAAESESSENT